MASVKLNLLTQPACKISLASVTVHFSLVRLGFPFPYIPVSSLVCSSLLDLSLLDLPYALSYSTLIFFQMLKVENLKCLQ